MDDQLLKGPDLAIPTELQEQYLQHLHEQMSLVVPYCRAIKYKTWHEVTRGFIPRKIHGTYIQAGGH